VETVLFQDLKRRLTKIKFSTNRKIIDNQLTNNSSIPRQHPQFESVPTPIQESQSFISSVLL